ncbi:MAG: hypothetical protein P8X82_19580 [Gemmatimonadales bacterium]|jgi:hypothetical protein
MTSNRDERFLQLPLEGYSDQTGVATVRTVSFDRRTRVRRAVGGLVGSWAAALVSVFIPVAHFLLVPGFFLAGLYLLFHNLRVQTSVTAATGVCPDCGREQEFEISGNWNPPHRLTCSGCQRSLLIRSN